MSAIGPKRTSSNDFVSKRHAGSTLQQVLETLDGKTGSHRVLRARVDSRRCRRGRPVLQEPVLGTADGKRPGIRGVLSEVPEALKAASAMCTAHVCL